MVDSRIFTLRKRIFYGSKLEVEICGASIAPQHFVLRTARQQRCCGLLAGSSNLRKHHRKELQFFLLTYWIYTIIFSRPIKTDTIRCPRGIKLPDGIHEKRSAQQQEIHGQSLKRHNRPKRKHPSCVNSSGASQADTIHPFSTSQIA